MSDPAAAVDAAAPNLPTSVPGRVVWRCRRGMKELDLVLQRYLRNGWPVASAADRAAFERILDLPDPLLAACLAGRESAPDPDLDRLLGLLRGA